MVNKDRKVPSDAGMLKAFCDRFFRYFLRGCNSSDPGVTYWRNNNTMNAKWKARMIQLTIFSATFCAGFGAMTLFLQLVA